jgi:hypothetical protein
VSRSRDIPMMPRRPPPYTNGIFSLVKASPTACAARVKIAWLPGDDPQLCLISRCARCCVGKEVAHKTHTGLPRLASLGNGA